MHEFFHVKRHDAILDPGLFSGNHVQTDSIDEAERIVDEQAANTLIQKDVLDSFILRVSPFFSKAKIIQFALRNKIHPGIVVGQLHHRTKNYRKFRDMLVSVRDLVTSEAVTDGWGRVVNS
jgi:HTH-type transcriptional regulator/antitoxin HigA